jgi:hypothetical protein
MSGPISLRNKLDGARRDAWIPLVHLVIELEQAETEETLDADAVIREARTSGIMPKGTRGATR